MSYSKKIVSPSIDKKIIIFLADSKKGSKNEKTLSLQNFVFVSKEKGTEKLILHYYFLLIT